MPLLQLGRRAAADLPYVGVDQTEAMGQVIAHLAGTGRRSFAYIGPQPDASAAGERLGAFLAHAVPLDPAAADRTYLGGPGIAWGREAAARLLDSGSRPDAIVCANDQAAAGALQALREHGCRVPDDVALTGFDDTVLAEACDPQLTTVRQPLEELGVQAVTALRAAINTRAGQPHSALLNAALVVRGSTRTAAPGRPAAAGS